MSRSTVTSMLMPIVGGLAGALLGVLMIASVDASPLRMALGVIFVGTGMASGVVGLLGRGRSAFRSSSARGQGRERMQLKSRLNPATQPKGKRLVAMPPVGRSLEEDSRIFGGGDFLTPTLGEMTGSFTRWFDGRGQSQDIWPSFDRWLRDTLSQFLRAEHVRCLRVEGDDLRLVSMSGDLEHGFWPGTPAPSLIQHVLATGRRYIQGAPGNGELIGKLVAEWPVNSGAEDGGRGTAAAPVWLVPVRKGNRTIGLVAAGCMPADVLRDLSTLQAVGHLLNLYWGFVDQARALHDARSTDQVSGVLGRSDLVASAERILEQAAIEEEPVVLLALSVEGVRGLDDEGRWSDRDWLIRQIGQALRGKLRSDDLVGRFSDDHFVAVLRRLDISLGRIIAGKLVEAAAEQVNAHPDLRQRVRVRCALCPRGGDGLETALTRLFDALQTARRDEEAVVTVAGDDAEVRVAGMVEER